MPDLILSEVSKLYKTPQGEVTILDGVSLCVAPGETLAIVGPSGSGKSTLLNIAGSLDKPTSGAIHIGDLEITKLEGSALAEFRANQVGFIFQDHHLLPQLTALENVLLPTVANKPSTLSPVEGRGEITDTAKALLARVGIQHRADAFPAQMSGGERQRVAIARALINGAKLLLCDEPTGNLDRAAGENIVSLLLELAAEQGATVIMVTHNISHAARFSKCFEIADGKLKLIDASSEAAR